MIDEEMTWEDVFMFFFSQSNDHQYSILQANVQALDIENSLAANRIRFDYLSEGLLRLLRFTQYLVLPQGSAAHLRNVQNVNKSKHKALTR